MSKQYRHLIQHKNVIKKAFKIGFSKKDSSIYIQPYAPNSQFHCGVSNFKSGETNSIITYPHIPNVIDYLKLSIHESGQVHVKNKENEIIVGPLQVPNLNTYSGQHIASIDINSIETLTDFKGSRKKNKNAEDLIFSLENQEHSMRFAIFANANSSDFTTPLPYGRITLERIFNPMYFAIKPVPQPIKDGGGMTLLAGFNPNQEFSETDYLYIRCD